MVHGSLTRSKRYSLFFTNRKWEKVSAALWQGKGIHCPLAGKGMVVAILYVTRRPASPSHLQRPARWRQELEVL